MNDSAWQGELDLVLTQHPSHQSHIHNSHKTVLSHSRAIAPYRVQRAFENPDGSCQVVMLHTAGGMVSGDRLVAKIRVEARAQALLTTAAAGKIYRSTGKQTQQRTHITVGTDARLEWLPQENIIFDGAEFRQSLHIDLAEGATALIWEVTRLGRTAQGERFVQGDWRSQTEVYRQGKPLWIDRQWLPASEALWQSPHGLAGQPIVGTIAWVGQAVTPEQLQHIRDAAQVNFGADQNWGLTRLPEGIVGRYRGNSSQAVRQGFLE